jgi:hypothetical protein
MNFVVVVNHVVQSEKITLDLGISVELSFRGIPFQEDSKI